MPIPTPRLLLLTLVGLVPMVLTRSPGLALFVGAIWIVGVVLIMLVDASTAPRRGLLEWRRDHESKLSLGAPNAVTLWLRNRSDRLAVFQVRDALPPSLPARGGSAAGWCPAGEELSLTYTVLPLRRGDFSFGPITARYRGILGLVWRQYTVHPEDRVKVYPNLLAIRAYESLARRGQLEEIGLRSSRRVGEGTEFERLRDYTPDDEYRRINWSATARRHTPVTVDYETERRQNVVLAIDTGRLMSTQIPLQLPPGALPSSSSDDAPAPALTRLDYAVNAALLLAFVTERLGDCAGLLAFGERVTRYLAPRPGRRQFLAITDALYNLEAEPIEADYTAGLGYLAHRLSRRSLIVVLTDLTDRDTAAALSAQAAHLSRRHLVLVAALRDPIIERLATALPHDSASLYERAVARSVLDDRDQVIRTLRSHGVLTLDVPADALSPGLVNRYLEIKARAML